ELGVLLLKALVVSNTEDTDAEDREDMVEFVEDRFVTAMSELNPTRVWLVSPRGLITEPVGFIWDGGDEGVRVLLGSDLDELRTEIRETPAGVIVVEGIEGLAITDPAWDGEPM